MHCHPEVESAENKPAPADHTLPRLPEIYRISVYIRDTSVSRIRSPIPTSFYIFNVFYFLVSILFLVLISVTARPNYKSILSSVRRCDPRT